LYFKKKDSMLSVFHKFIYLIFIISIVGCAKRGTITGGLKDSIAPILKTSIPKNFTTNFTGNTIKLSFDEYIKLKNINKQLIISPPMKVAPEILPSTASKYISIKIKDTLIPNTTYSFNFGQSIEDNNESNPYRQFKYVFSTGSYIDSLSLAGTIKDAYAKKAETFVTVMLYEINEKFTDSIIFKENPRYVTNTLDSATTFTLENLKAGKYMLVGIKDVNNNYKFDPKTDKIGFHKQYVTIPNDTLYELELFKEIDAFKTVKATQASGNRLLLGYEGKSKNTKIALERNGASLETIVTKFPGKDSLQVWYKPIKLEAPIKIDSLQLKAYKDDYSQLYSVKIKNQKVDTLSFAPSSTGVLPLREKFKLVSSIPLVKFDASKMQLINKDSVSIALKSEYDEMKQEVTFDFLKEPLQKYKLTLMPGAMTDYMERVNDTLNYTMETRNSSEYGNLRLKLENVKEFPVMIELTDSKGEIQYSEYSESETQIDFNGIKPALYTLRIIYDANKNKEWDTGSFLEKRQTEEVIYFPKEIDVRANWDVEQSFNLKF
jgi:uncharacterized protein (DUF2141 family)